MSDLAPLLQRFFTDKLDRHLNASPHTKAAYADTFRLLLTYAQQATGIAPSALTLADLDADLIGGFLWSVPEKMEAVNYAASSWMSLYPSSYSCGVK